MIIDLEQIENLAMKKAGTSISHDFGHLRRTAIGAAWFAGVLGGNSEQQNTAYIAGLVHDFNRPLTEKVEHKETSLTEAGIFLDRLHLDKAMKNKILRMVEAHREMSDIPIIEQSVFLSDKIFEQMGAYIIVRRCIYVGECEDYKNNDFYDSVKKQFSSRLGKFKPEAFPDKFRSLAGYQYSWPLSFFKAFSEKQTWALRFAEYFYNCGKNRYGTMKKCVRDYRPLHTGDNKFIHEALLYMNGEIYANFEKLVS